MNPVTVKVDNIIWYVTTLRNLTRDIQPLCPIHSLRMYPQKYSYQSYSDDAELLKCEDCSKPYGIPRNYKKEKAYVIDRIDAKVFKGLQVLNLDDEALPIARDKISDSDYFVTSLLTKSKIGLRLVVYAGKKGYKDKTQIFVEPEIKRLAFDQKNTHPSDVFTKLEATFKDGSTASMVKK